MASFLDAFPKVAYDITKNKLSNYQVVTNITFRLAIVKQVIENAAAYIKYTITDTDTPEILAEKIYGNPEAYWIIFYANDIVDPQYDWPLNTRAFNNYIIDKYGSIETAKTTYHHYEKVISREIGGITTTFRFKVNQSSLTVDEPPVPYDTYDSLPATQSVETFSVNGKTVVETTSRNRVSNYDWEDQQNEKKREIKIIKSEYYERIYSEFNSLTKADDIPYIRKLKY